MSQAASLPMKSPFHRGERAIQRRLGIADQAEDLGRRMIRDHMPDPVSYTHLTLPTILRV